MSFERVFHCLFVDFRLVVHPCTVPRCHTITIIYTPFQRKPEPQVPHKPFLGTYPLTLSKRCGGLTGVPSIYLSGLMARNFPGMSMVCILYPYSKCRPAGTECVLYPSRLTIQAVLSLTSGLLRNPKHLR